MKFIMAVLGVILLVVLVIVLFTRGGGDKQPTVKPVVVSEEAREGVSVVLTTRGKLVGEDERRGIRITVNQDERRLEILTGYEEAVERAQVYPNTHAAFENFLVALDQMGFNRSRLSAIEDERGACPTGKTYIYELREYSQQLVRLWDTSCGSKIGTMDGKDTTVRKLFEEQIPDYTKQVQGVDLNGTKPKTDEETAAAI
jgi:hypothetical protein